jgi:anti-anti-sigma factor
MQAGFWCDVKRVGKRSTVVAVGGDLDMHTSEELVELMAGLHDRGASDHLVFDLSECTFIDSIGLSVLIRAQHLAKSPLHIVVSDEGLRRVLSVTGLAAIFKLYETESEALADLDGQPGDVEEKSARGTS